MIMVWMSSGITAEPHRRSSPPMHDLLIGLAFVGMVISPAIVAAFSNTSEEANAE